MKKYYRTLYLSILASAAMITAGSFIGNAAETPLNACPAAVYENESVRELLVPCGTPFGIKMLTDGVVVTDFGYVDGAKTQNSPAESAGIRTGDIITAVNGISVSDSAAITSAVQLQPEECRICIRRGDECLELTAKAVQSSEDGLYKLGLWTRDSCAGIGTMTFYDPETGVFGGLGHSVSDVTTGQRLPLLSGEITAVSITEVLKGGSGAPGELCGAFVSDTETGTVEINSEYGVFGYSDIVPILNEPVETALSSEIKEGKACILTTIAGMMPETYDIEIVKIDRSSNSERNMTIRITDPKLLSRTGGIVQGMSGSPILQDGRLIGAVTHVLVSDSAMGYATFIENMCSEADTLKPTLYN